MGRCSSGARRSISSCVPAASRGLNCAGALHNSHIDEQPAQLPVSVSLYMSCLESWQEVVKADLPKHAPQAQAQAQVEAGCFCALHPCHGRWWPACPSCWQALGAWRMCCTGFRLQLLTPSAEGWVKQCTGQHLSWKVVACTPQLLASSCRIACVTHRLRAAPRAQWCSCCRAMRTCSC